MQCHCSYHPLEIEPRVRIASPSKEKDYIVGRYLKVWTKYTHIAIYVSTCQDKFHEKAPCKDYADHAHHLPAPLNPKSEFLQKLEKKL